MRMGLFVVVTLVALPLAWGQQDKRCSDLAGANLEHAKVVHAAAVTRTELDEMDIPKSFSEGSFCRVQVVDRPSSDSEIRTEVWLPLAGWNGRLRAQGNGGFAGVISLKAMAETVRQGYATVGTDTGHIGATGDFALGHPEKVKDFGWRGVHEMTVEAKELIRAFYGKEQEKAYFTSCSDGGREALMEAERFPADYDGILAGAPAYDWTRLLAGAAESVRWMNAKKENYLPSEKVAALAAAVNKACDALDGVKDGVINDPRTCKFDPATMVCKAGDANDCLLPEQVETVRRTYGGVADASGKVVVPGLMPGAEDGKEGWSRWITGDGREASMTFYSRGYFANFVYSDPSWTTKEFNFDSGYKLAGEKTADALNATDANLQPFLSRGGRLILYHGWNDPGIPALMTVNYYNALVDRIGGKSADEGVRLYMVPGMQHCGGGPGATEFGQGMGPRGDATHDVFTALEQWTEKGTAPGALTTAKLEGTGAARTVVMTRPLCPYPQIAKYDGKGDTSKAGSFVCVAGGK